MDQEWTYRPPLLVGEKVEWHGGASGIGSKDLVAPGTYVGTVSWIGRIPDVGTDWVVGIDFGKPIPGGGDGSWKNRRMFTSPRGFALFLPIAAVIKKTKDDSLQSSKSKFSSGEKSRKTQTKGSKSNESKGSPEKPKTSKASNEMKSKETPKNKPSTGASNVNKSPIPSEQSPEGNGSRKTSGILKKDKSAYKKSNSLQHLPCRTNLSPPLTQGHILDESDRSKSDRGGILNIFKWFSKKGTKHSHTFSQQEKSNEPGNTNSLGKTGSHTAFSPIRHSKSADNPKTMKSAYKNSLSKQNFSSGTDISQVDGSSFGSDGRRGGRRKSTLSLQSTGSQVSILSACHRSKKRPAPQPPGSPALSQSGLSISDASFSGSRSTTSFNSMERINRARMPEKEGRIYCKAKRMAPQPPSNLDSGISIDKESASNFSSGDSSRPESSAFSSLGSISQSDTSTLKSGSCSEGDDFLGRSDNSLNKLSNFPLSKSEREPLSPKPWYKRKKLKNTKEKPTKSSKSTKENGFDSWMPDIQYSRQNLELSPATTKKMESSLENRFSLLSNISDLDRAAAELLKREKEQKAEKLKDDKAFYNSSLRILSQKDILPEKHILEDEGAVSLPLPEGHSAYDNVKYPDSLSTMPISYSKQPTLKLNGNGTHSTNSTISNSANHFNELDRANNNTPTSFKSSVDINGDQDEPSSNEQLSRETPLQKAIFDSELFYQLAKDAKFNADSKRKSPTTAQDPKQQPVSSSGKEEVVNPFEQDFLSHLRRPNKNFGIRMNNIFTPDVSTILEGSESITSSSATPAEDLESDFFAAAIGGMDRSQELLSVSSEIHSDYQINTLDLQEIMKSFAADVANEAKAHVDNMRSDCKKAKSDQKRDEAMLMREQDNFLAWQKAMRDATESGNSDEAAKALERKKKWVCSSCTLINQPWRLHCEACSTLRPPNPKRIDQEDSSAAALSDNASSLHSHSNASPITVIHDERTEHDANGGEIGNPLTPTREPHSSGWENELERYFTDFDIQANNLKHLHSTNSADKMQRTTTHDLQTQLNSKLPNDSQLGAKPKLRNGNNRDDFDLDEIRRARINKFTQENLQSSSTPATQIDLQDKQDLSSASIKPSKLSQKDSNIFKTNIVSEMQSLFGESEDKKYYQNHPKKQQIAMPSGAVKNVISIFNQMDQFKQVSKPVQNRRRRSVSSIPSQDSLEDNISIDSRPETKSPIQLDVDISSAISKFDEMAAMAEVDRLPVSKLKGLVRRGESAFKPIKSPKLQHSVSHHTPPSASKENKENPLSLSQSFNIPPDSIQNCVLRNDVSKSSELKTKSTPDKEHKKGFTANNISPDSTAKDFNKSEKENQQQVSADHNSNLRETPSISGDIKPPIQRSNSSNEFTSTNHTDRGDSPSHESVIKDGILYTGGGEHRRRSMSIGSGTFELIHAKDFASISAHHSRRSSPTQECNGYDSPLQSDELELAEPGEESTFEPAVEEVSVEASSSKASEKNLVSIIEEERGRCDVERLSRQLTEKDGIETFKASLKNDLSEMNSMNTLTIGRVLKALEAAIANGHHKEASRLAHDLAKMRLSCSVTRSTPSSSDPPLAPAEKDAPPQPPTSGPRDDPQARSNEEDGELNKRSFRVPESPPKDLGGTPPNSLENGVDDPSWSPSGPVVIRPTKIDPLRREVKSESLRRVNGPREERDLSEFSVQMYVEDKASHQGPIPVTVQLTMTVGYLKQKVEEEFGFPREVQRWILGKKLADDDSQTLAYHKVTADKCPIFLYLVAPERETGAKSKHKKKKNKLIDDFKKSLTRMKESKSLQNVPKEATKPSSDADRVRESKGPQGKRLDPLHSESDRKAIFLNEDQLEEAFEELYQQEKASATEEMMSDIFNRSPSPQMNTRKPEAAKKKKESPDAVKQKAHGAKAKHAKSASTSPKLSGPKNSKNISKASPSAPTSSPPPFTAGPENPRGEAAANADWSCPQCTLLNPRERPGCAACAADRPSDIMKCNLNVAMKALDRQGCVPNLEPFECVVCFLQVEPREGVVLRECLHAFCRNCLRHAVIYSDTAQVKCPFMDDTYSCDFSLQEREIKDLVTAEEYTKHHEKSVKQAASAMTNVFYCKTPDCKGFCQYEDNVNEFHCDVCSKKNCLTCQAQHENVTCKQYQDDLVNKQDESALKTKKFFDDMIRRGNGMPCPHCSVMLVRKWGCDWMRCPMCRTEICWVTRGPRWGPEGQGDTSGGCKCGINGRKCHPKCTYCH